MAVLLVVLITTVALPLGCTKPDYQSVGISLLNTLIDELPVVPMPPETASNRYNESYLLVKQEAGVVEGTREAFHRLFLRIRDEWSGPFPVGNSYEWNRIHDDEIRVTSFQITPGGSITFFLTHVGPSTQHVSPFTGWIDRNNNSGHIDFVGFSTGGFGWFPYPEGLSMGTVDGGFGYGVIDSSAGGGRVEIWEILLDAKWFEGGWDAAGHGWCGNPFDGPDW